MGRISAESRREILVDAAIEVISDLGIAGATTRVITDRAQMSLASFHYAFVSRETLFLACLDRVTRSESAAFADFEFVGGDMASRSTEAMEHLAGMIRESWREQLVLYELSFYAMRRTELRCRVHEYRRATRDLISSLVTRSLEGSGDRLTGEARAQLVSLALTLSDGMTTGYLRDRDEEELDRIVAASALTLGYAATALLGRPVGALCVS